MEGSCARARSAAWSPAIAALPLFLCFADAGAVTISLPVGYDALLVPVGARTGAMGETGLALAYGPTSLHHNPALLVGVVEPALSLAHAQWFQRGNHNGLAFAQPYRRGAAGVALLYLDHGSYEARDLAGAAIPGRHRASELALRAGYAEAINRHVRGGLSAAFSAESLTSGMALSSVSVDAGAVLAPWADRDWDKGKRPILFALKISQLGQPRQGGRLPATLSLGGAYEWPSGKKDARNGAAALAADVHVGLTGWLRAQAGGEYWLLDAACLRAGYRWNAQGEPYDDYSGFSAGLGLRLARYGLDYAFAPYGELGATHRFSLEIPL